MSDPTSQETALLEKRRLGFSEFRRERIRCSPGTSWVGSPAFGTSTRMWTRLRWLETSSPSPLGETCSDWWTKSRPDSGVRSWRQCRSVQLLMPDHSFDTIWRVGAHLRVSRSRVGRHSAGGRVSECGRTCSPCAGTHPAGRSQARYRMNVVSFHVVVSALFGLCSPFVRSSGAVAKRESSD